MSTKIFIDANTLLLDSLRLAKRIYEDGYRPDFFIGIWRGGTPPGIAIHEFFVYKGVMPKYHTAIKAESYYGIEERGAVFVEGLNQIVSRVEPGDSILIIDDVFDTGKSIERVKSELEKRIRSPYTIRIATVYFKPKKNLTALIPDYYLKEVDEWIVFPHEILGLSKEELKEKGKDIFELLKD